MGSNILYINAETHFNADHCRSPLHPIYVIRHSLIILLFDTTSSGFLEDMIKLTVRGQSHTHITAGSRRKCSLPKQQITIRYFK